MGRYKGKREASRAGVPEQKSMEAAPKKIPAVGDPFAAEGEKPPFSVRMHHFWDSGRGKILLAVAVCLVILGTAAGIAIKMWVKPPEMPVQDDIPMVTVDKVSITPSSRDEEEPSEDELYPDDGYGGEMPTVSGNRKEGYYTFLLVGTDMDDGNTDTIMVVTYDTKNQDISIMSIPRDTMINESWDIKKINSVYSRYKDGMEALKKRVKTLVGFTPDFYVKVDLNMFVKLVDLIGGVEFDVPQDMNYDDPYQDLHIHLKKGVQVLDGEKAMEMVRFRRYSEGDIKRVEMQQNFIKALIKECLSIKNWGKIKAYIDLAMENVQTDLEMGSVVWFAANVLGINSGVPALNMDDVYTCTIPGDYWGSAWSRTTSSQQSYVTIYPKEVVKLVNERFNPYEQNVTTSMLDAMSILSNGCIASSTGSVRDTTHNAVVSGKGGSSSGSKTDTDKKDESTAETPKKDDDGKYYIVDDDGKKVYTDQNGKPLENTGAADEPQLPGIPANPTDSDKNSNNSNNNSNNSNNNSGGNKNDNGQTDNSDPGTDTPGTGSSGGSNAGDVPASDSGIDPGNASGNTDPEPQLPSEPQIPSEPSVPAADPEPAPPPPAPVDEEIPDWLLT